MADPINETIILSNLPALIPIVDGIRSIIEELQWLVGGIFGLYLILVFLRWRESRQLVKLLKEIKVELKSIGEGLKKKHK